MRSRAEQHDAKSFVDDRSCNWLSELSSDRSATGKAKSGAKHCHRADDVPHWRAHTLKLTLTGPDNKQYSINTAGYDRSGRLHIDTFDVSPAAGWSDPLARYFSQGAIAGGLSGSEALSSKPTSFDSGLNEHVRFDQPHAHFTHTVIDTGQRQTAEDLRAAYATCDLIIIPSVPASLDTDGLGQTIRAIREHGPDRLRVLLPRVPPDAAKETAELRGLLLQMNVEILTSEIPMLKAFAKAAATGEIVNQTKDRNAHRAWGAYKAAGKEIRG